MNGKVFRWWRSRNDMTKKLLGAILLCEMMIGFYPVICHAKNYSEVADKLQKGQTKEAITKLLGEPVRKRITGKNHKYIWGPEEEFWDRIPMGTRLEVWEYEFSDGHLNLYFIDGKNHLDFKAFAPKGVIY